MTYSPTTEPGRAACPLCGAPGQPIKLQTLYALLKAEAQHRIRQAAYRFCATPGCDVVYFQGEDEPPFTRADLKVRVGLKETEAPRPVCYCFGHTVEEIWAEIERTGTSAVTGRIRDRIREEGCRCEETNPQGSCCLGVVSRVVREGLERFGAGTGTPATGASGCCGPEGCC